jgi:hypothetical protein
MPPQQPTSERSSNSKSNMRDSNTTSRHRTEAIEVSTMEKERTSMSKPQEKTSPPIMKRFGRLSFHWSKSTATARAASPAVSGKRRLSLRRRTMPVALHSATSSASGTSSREFRDDPDGVNVPLVLRQQQTKIITVQGDSGGTK